jgi:hypothetical protein
MGFTRVSQYYYSIDILVFILRFPRQSQCPFNHHVELLWDMFPIFSDSSWCTESLEKMNNTLVISNYELETRDIDN